MPKVPLLFIFLFCSICSTAQTPRIDSLKLLLDQNQFSQNAQQLEIINQLFDEFYYLGDHEGSLSSALQLIDKAKKLNYPAFLRQGKLNKALALLKENKEEGVGSIEKILAEAKAAEDHLIVGLCQLHLGIYQFDVLKKQEDSSYFEKAKNSLQKAQSLKEVTASLYIALCNQEKEGYEAALTLLQQAYKKVEHSNHPILLLQMLRGLLFYQFQLGYHLEASETAHQFIIFATENKYYTGGLIHAYAIARDLLMLSNDLEEARRYAEMSYQISKKVNDNVAKARAASGLAIHYIDFVPEKHDTAKVLLDYSIDLSQKHQLGRRQYTALYFYGILYEKKGEKEKAVEKYLESLSVLEADSEVNKRFGFRIKSKISTLIDLLPKTFEVFPEDDAIAQENIDSLNLYPKRLFYLIKKNLALDKNNMKEAFKWYKKEVEVFLKIKDQENKINIKEIILENQLESEHQANLKNQELLSQSKVINGLLAFSSILFMLFVGLLTRKNKAVKKLNKEILVLNNSLKEKNELLKEKNEVKSKELIEFSAYKAKHEKELQKIKNDFEILSNKQNLNPADLKLIQSKIGDLQSEEEDNWISFKEKIEDSNPGFFSNLALIHPNLTTKDKYHCGYILIGLSVKVVAELSFVSQATVNSSRYRIKKKLGLKKEKRLREYLIDLATGNIVNKGS